MNKEDTKKCIAVMQAYVDGEQIECEGLEIPIPLWEWMDNPDRYKVAPKKKYRPFTAVEVTVELVEEEEE